jgi:hypothetical protein
MPVAASYRESTPCCIDVRSAASASDQRAVIAVNTLSFGSDPMARWAFPDPAAYLEVMPEMVRAFGGNGFAHGAAHVSARASPLPCGCRLESIPMGIE